ncbi:MAG: hypothetical protein KBD46_02940 [Candidatus Levybacteria bacterium]|nr:hypothetical protein [Candidatus Levybacteria bacterium]
MEEAIPKKQNHLYLIFAAVIVIILLVIGYFSLVAPSSLPKSFFSKYQEQDILIKQTLPAMQFDLAILSQQIQAKNASEAARLVKNDLIQSLKNRENSKVISKKMSELKILLASVNDTALREKIIKLFGLMDERNRRLQALIDTQTNVFTVLRNHFGALAVGKKADTMPQNIDSVIGASQIERQSLSQLQTSIDVAFEEIIKLSGVDTSTSQTADAIRMSLSTTPAKDPQITDFPTATPAPTLEPTEIPASPSATETATPSAQ